MLIEILSIDPEIAVHIWTKRVWKWSTIDASAIKVGKDVAEIGSTYRKLFINGREVQSIKSNSISVEQSIPLS